MSKKRIAPQSFKNGEIHDWYRLVMGYSDHLVSDLLDEFQLTTGGAVLDPFSGAGTTAVECKKRGIDCWAMDANPVGCFATSVKTTWNVSEKSLIDASEEVSRRFAQIRPNLDPLRSDSFSQYLINSGMIARGWITYRRLYDIAALKHSIRDVVKNDGVANALLLAAANVLVHKASTVRFGPELYCGPARRGDVLDAFVLKVSTMAGDIEITRGLPKSKTVVLRGDSRQMDIRQSCRPKQGFDAIITSPPYPAEHDYTRNTRLELAFLEHVKDRDGLQVVKKAMLRSHTKGIYSTDSDDTLVKGFPRLQKIVAKIERKSAEKSHGFARLYGKVTNEYFGGMRLHFRNLRPLLRSGAKCAYVVGDQSSYLQVPIPTAELLGELAQMEGFNVEQVRTWRNRWVSATKRRIKERILILSPN